MGFDSLFVFMLVSASVVLLFFVFFTAKEVILNSSLESFFAARGFEILFFRVEFDLSVTCFILVPVFFVRLILPTADAEDIGESIGRVVFLYFGSFTEFLPLLFALGESSSANLEMADDSEFIDDEYAAHPSSSELRC